MNKYIIRVQIPNATAEDIKTLDVEMKKMTFRPAKKDHAGKKAVSDAIEYNYSGKMILQELSLAVSSSAQKTARKFSFTVMKEKSPLLNLVS